ncbi:MAG: hypothetical protein MUE78_06825 [Ilumatobacteraceae bacterium]|nr:hypothetical protein [Ilumatobacteraceae bacterium]
MSMSNERLPFLSDEWRAAVRALVAELEGSSVDRPGLVVNATITGVPFGPGTLDLHSEHGPLVGWEPGHADGAAFEIRTDYYTAKALVLDSSPTADGLAQGFSSGAVDVVGDRARYREWWTERMHEARAAELDDRIRAITS